MKKLIFNLAIYICLYGLSYLEQTWFIFFPKEYFRILCILFFCLEVFHFIFKPKLNFNFPIFILFVLSFFGMIFLPIQNLKMGDGILLLNYFNLESFYFGYHLTLDEILEALIHSFFYKKFFLTENQVSNPMIIYRIISTLLGGILLFQIYKFVKKNQFKLSTSIIILTSGGMGLFYGYSENYTIISFLIWNYIFYVLNILEKNYNGILELSLICILASLMILTHLVSGYLIFSLIYICYLISKKKFIRNSIYSFLICSAIILPVIIYFSFFSSVRFDFLQTHLTNPKFYPLKEIFGLEHFRNILFSIFGSSFFAFIILMYGIIFHKTEMKNLLKEKKIKFLLTVLFGFSVHGFVHFPQLGFPADWDLLAFFWTPILFLGVYSYQKFEMNSKFLILFVFIFFISNSFYNSKLNKELIPDLEISIQNLNLFIQSEKLDFSMVKPEHKKFYLKTKYFLFESKNKILKKDKSNYLLKENIKFANELERRNYDFNKTWQRDFYKRLTKYHLDFLKIE